MNETVNVFVSPGPSVNDDGVTGDVDAVIDVDEVYVAALSSTFVTRRFTVCDAREIADRDRRDVHVAAVERVARRAR